MVAPILGSISAYFLFVVAVVVLLWGIVFLVHSIQCILKPGNSYERFADVAQTEDMKKKIEDYLLAAMKSYIQKVDSFSNSIQTTFPETMDTTVDKTCKIYGSIQDNYVKNKTEMQDSSEMDLSSKEREQLAQKRLKRGADQFNIRKKLYVAKSKTPLYECFEDAPSAESTTDSSELEILKTELDQKTEELAIVVASDIFQNRIKSIDSLKSTMGMNIMFLEESINELAKSAEGFVDVSALPKVSDAELNLPFSILSATDTQKTYIESMRNAAAVIKSILEIPQMKNNELDTLSKKQNDIWDTLHTKKRDLETKSEKKAKDEQEKRKQTADAKKPADENKFDV